MFQSNETVTGCFFYENRENLSQTESLGWNFVSLTRREKQILFKAVLARVEVVITAAQRKELCMVSAFHNSSLLHYKNLIRSPNRGEPMCNHKRRSAHHQ